MRKIVLYQILFGMFFIPNIILAQIEPEDMALANNEFENNLYESFKQKGIENYDKAIQSLDKCLVLEPNNPVVFFELGKNYLAQKKFTTAYSYFEKVTQIDPNNRWAWVGMYDVCYETKDYNKAIPLVEKLIEFKEEYREDLVSLYMNTQQYDKALELINLLNETVGKSEKRELYKADILKDAKYQSAEKFDLVDKINKFPKEESNYIALIYMYSQNNQEEKAMEIAQKLEKEIPTSDWAQVSLFKFHLNNNEGEKAVKAMNIVLPSSKIDSKIKHRILNEFLIFTNSNPQFENDLDKAIAYFDEDKKVDVSKEIAKYYFTKSNWAKARKYFEKQVKSNPDDVESQKLLLQTYLELQDFVALASKAEDLTQYYPTQPDLYYSIGLAQNQLGNFKKAKDALEAGLDFIIDDVPLEINYYLQLSEAFNGLGDLKKKETNAAKANDLLKKQKK